MGIKIISDPFIEEGESAKSANRTEFQNALQFCAKRKPAVDYFIVHKIDRFARNQADHVATQAVLRKQGTTLVSATEPIDQTVMGKAMEGMLSVWAELDNNIRAERSKNGMIEKVRTGVWVWNAPIGYKRIVSGGNLLPDETSAPYIKLCFEEWAKGTHTYRSLAKMLYERGFRTRSDGKVYPQLIQKILKNPIYAGIIEVFDMKVKGAFTPIIDEELFYKCQPKKLNPTTEKRKRVSPDFPLRGFVSCTECGQKLTASYSKGNGGKYPYYHHQKGGCPESTFTPKITFEQNFAEFLGEISPRHKRFEKVFKAVVMDVWQSNYKKLDAENERVRKELVGLEKERQKVFDLHRGGTYSDSEFTEQKDRINEIIQQKKLYLEEKRVEEFNMEEALGHCFEFVRDSAKTWIELAKLPEFQLRFQNLVFPQEKITYNGVKFGTDKVSLVYEINQQSGAEKSKVVTLRGIEPRFLA